MLEVPLNNNVSLKIFDPQQIIIIYFAREEQRKTAKMTETYSGRTTFGDINFTPDQIDEYKDAFEAFDIGNLRKSKLLNCLCVYSYFML